MYIQNIVIEMEKVPSGFGVPRNPHVSAHGVLRYSGWQPNPERTVLTPPWLQANCCLRWPAHNESVFNGLCFTLNCPYSIEVCPICASRATHFDSVFYLLSVSYKYW